MKIQCRKVDKYMEVNITEGNIKYSLGLLDDKERIALARIFEEAIDELLYKLTPNDA